MAQSQTPSQVCFYCDHQLVEANNRICPECGKRTTVAEFTGPLRRSLIAHQVVFGVIAILLACSTFISNGFFSAHFETRQSIMQNRLMAYQALADSQSRIAAGNRDVGALHDDLTTINASLLSTGIPLSSSVWGQSNLLNTGTFLLVVICLGIFSMTSGTIRLTRRLDLNRTDSEQIKIVKRLQLNSITLYAFIVLFAMMFCMSYLFPAL